MFVGRAEELKFLEDYYTRQGNQMVIVYGRYGIGKTDLVRMLLMKNQGRYYMARECSEREQLLCLNREWKERYELLPDGNGLGGLLLAAAKTKEKAVIVLDEFHLMEKGCGEFSQALRSLMEQRDHEVLLLLCSSSVNWIENDMVRVLQGTAAYISALMKVREFTFLDMAARFPDKTMEECVSVYGILGGIPKYLNYWNTGRSVKDNVKALILNRDGRLHREAQNVLKSELRELALYNTILAALAADEENMKLNNLYDRTGFSRAKISVYLKNLIQLDVVEKVFSFEAGGKENTKKGLYRIRDHFIFFWYKYVFPNLSELENGRVEQVYEAAVAPTLDRYLETFFTDVCREYIGLLDRHQKLPLKIREKGSWFGKNGTIDYLAEGTNGKIMAAKCKWQEQPMNEADLEQLLLLLTQAEMDPDYYYLFSKSGFTSGLEAKAKCFESIRLISMDKM